MNRRADWLVLAAAMTLAFPAFGYVHFINPQTGLPKKWPAGPIALRVMLGDSSVLSDGRNFNTSFASATQGWNNAIGSVRLETTLLPAGAATSQNGTNEVAFSATVEGMQFPSGTLAITRLNGEDNRILEADIFFNTARTWDSYSGPPRPNPELRRVAVHELGHVLGLDHVTDAGSISIMGPNAASFENPSSDDRRGAQELYGPPGVAAHDRFSNAVALNLDGSNRASGESYNTNATKEPGEPAHAGNAGGRSVWWRWTASAAGYATVDTRESMSDTTLGIYVGDSVGNLTTVTGSDDIEMGIVQASQVQFLVTAGTTYRIAVDGFNAEEQGIPGGADSARVRVNLRFFAAAVTAPAITTQPVGATLTAGNPLNLSVTATGTEPLTYEWLHNGTRVSLDNTANLRLEEAPTEVSGNYQVIVSNAAGSVTSQIATVTVNPTTPPPPPVVNPPSTGGSSGGGGGGGAPSLGFLAALAALFAARKTRAPRWW